MWSGTITESLILMATLTRFAFALRLNYENPNLCSLAQESRRRLMWAIYILDTFLAGGLPEFTLCPSTVIHLPLPNLEASFELDISYANVPLYDSGPSSTVDDNGLLAYYIRVIYLRDSVLRYGVPQKMISGEERNSNKRCTELTKPDIPKGLPHLRKA